MNHSPVPESIEEAAYTLPGGAAFQTAAVGALDTANFDPMDWYGMRTTRSATIPSQAVHKSSQGDLTA